MKGNFAAIVLILIGVVALAVNLDWLDFDLVELLRTWWPLLPIAVGIALFLTPGEGGSKAR
ncbi:MAG: hypothetical protein CVU18_19125 [Betaproteobacteria bacterium HGW-Betaproteobacteria-12]|nr:MAG: hypothetical protein CVU18_19125 [Betaproteobacteria bacterium HGW-Betaproteobacteria-12]